MIDIKEFRKGLQLDDEEMAAISQNSGISRTRLTMAEHGVVTLKPEEESILRLAIDYAIHCRKTKLLVRLGQGQFDTAAPMTWDECQKKHQSSTMPREMKVMTIAVKLQEIDGQVYFPLSEPIPWQIDLTDAGAKVLASQPDVLSSMIEGIKTTVAFQGH